MARDWCTAAPDFHFGPTCCKQHDHDYSAQTKTRGQADRDMLVCIAQADAPARAVLYWLAVRTFGWLHWKRKTRAKKRAAATLEVTAP
jgi:hypothetical protein